MLNGVDVSQWQGEIDWPALAPTIDFAMIRASDGVGFQDTWAWWNRVRAREAGKLIGHYHFARANQGSAATQARVFLDSVGVWDKGEIFALDIEVDAAGLIEWAANFARILINETGIAPFIYTNVDFINRWDMTVLADLLCPLWLANWSRGAASWERRGPWESPKIIQTTDNGQKPGIADVVDLDISTMDESEWRSLGASIAHG